MTTQEKHNLIKRINSRLDNVANTLGTSSQLYQRYSTLLRSFFPGKASATRLSDNNGRLNIRRTQDVLQNVSDNALRNIESRMKRDSLQIEKFKIREYLRNEEGFKGRVGVADYQAAAAKLTDLSSNADENIALFYDYSETPEGAAGIAIARKKGKKSYGDLAAMQKLADSINDKVARGEYQPTPLAPKWVRRE